MVTQGYDKLASYLTDTYGKTGINPTSNLLFSIAKNTSIKEIGPRGRRGAWRPLRPASDAHIFKLISFTLQISCLGQGKFISVQAN